MASTPSAFRNGAVGFIDWLGGRGGFMPSVLRNSEFFTSAFLGKRERVLKVIVRALLAFKGVNVESSTRILLDLECATAM